MGWKAKTKKKTICKCRMCQGSRYECFRLLQSQGKGCRFSSVSPVMERKSDLSTRNTKTSTESLTLRTFKGCFSGDATKGICNRKPSFPQTHPLLTSLSIVFQPHPFAFSAPSSIEQVPGVKAYATSSAWHTHTYTNKK